MKFARQTIWGVIAGVTTNPSLIAKEGRDYAQTPRREIASIVDGPISGEVKATTTDAEAMVKEGRAIYALDPKHMVVKIPMTAEGLKAIKTPLRRRHSDQLHADFLGQSGAAGGARGRGVCQPVSGQAGRHLPAGHRADPHDCGDFCQLSGYQNPDHRRERAQPDSCDGLCAGGHGHRDGAV